MTRIAVVGMACRYPDAGSSEELWENVLAGRRAFRRPPSHRFRVGDYLDVDPDVAETLERLEVAVLDGYAFDRVGFRVSGRSYRAADLSHWLALDVAAEALSSAGFPAGRGLPRETTGVLVGNTLTGEFSRAQVLNLRWPYVRRVVSAGLEAEGLAPAELTRALDRIERLYRRPFEPLSEETLEGGLSNTIAGRICNHFDLGGGGYTVDGACASSLLAIARACSALAEGDLDVAVAGGWI